MRLLFSARRLAPQPLDGLTVFGPSLTRGTLPLFREGLSDFHRDGERAGMGDVRRHAYHYPVLGERHQRRHSPTL